MSETRKPSHRNLTIVFRTTMKRLYGTVHVIAHHITGCQWRDNHFSSPVFPEIKFRSTSVHRYVFDLLQHPQKDCDAPFPVRLSTLQASWSCDWVKSKSWNYSGFRNTTWDCLSLSHSSFFVRRLVQRNTLSRKTNAIKIIKVIRTAHHTLHFPLSSIT